jgi:hypothetical protein
MTVFLNVQETVAYVKLGQAHQLRLSAFADASISSILAKGQEIAPGQRSGADWMACAAPAAAID